MISHDVISSQMAGPGIRYLELALVLSHHFEVVLASPNDSDLEGTPLRLHPYRYGDWERLRPALEGADVILATGFSLYEFPALRQCGIPLVVDLYDPFPLENLYLFGEKPLDKQMEVHHTDRAILDLACTLGDFFICAQPRQRDWWLGMLQAHGRVNPLTVAQDPTLRALIDEVPFGLPSRPLVTTGKGPKNTVPGLTPDDRLLLWGGGIWNWLDPLALIRAMPAVLAQEPRARLLFPGTRHPNSYVPEMERTREAFALADELGLTDKAIFFGEWVPYEAWADYLADSDIAVSLHHDTLETHFSAVRSRVLSYIWARLPMVVTGGDAASRLVEQHGLGEVVPYGNVEAVSTAILAALAQDKATYAPRFDTLASHLTWEEVARPLVAFCQAPHLAPDKGQAWDSQAENHAGLYQEQQREIERLERTVTAYEQGRFMRLMRHLDGLKRGRW